MPGSDRPLRILVVEDNPADVLIIRERLADAWPEKFALDHVESLADALARVRDGGHDVALVDLALPDSRGLDTFESLQAQAPASLPIVVLSGLDDRDVALEAVRRGAQDYLVKGHVDGHGLARAMRYAVERKRGQLALEQLVQELQETLARVRTLSGLLPICAGCKKIRDDRGYWKEVEVYITQRSEAQFSHGICPACKDRLYPGT